LLFGSNILTHKDFLGEADKKHKKKYDYSCVVYYNATKCVKIICKLHGIFEISPKTHLKGVGCALCKKQQRQKRWYDLVMKQASKLCNKKYDYKLISLEDCKNIKSKIKIICPDHGVFSPQIGSYLRGVSCYFCKCLKSGIKKSNKNLNRYLRKTKKIHSNKYDYSLVNTFGLENYIKIICPEHGVFVQNLKYHMRGHGCPRCTKYKFVSEKEKIVRSFIIENCNQDIVTKNRSAIGQELDIFISIRNLAFEYNGLYWHCEEIREKDYHLIKTKMCEEKNIHLIHIFEDDWIEKQIFIKSLILQLLNKNKEIDVSVCKIKEVNRIEKEDFLEKNDIIGNKDSQINLGIYYRNRLIFVCTFQEVEQNGCFEIKNLCNKLYTTVNMGFELVLKYFLEKTKPENIVSYADRSFVYKNNNVYKTFGFTLKQELSPNCFYIIKNKRIKDTLVNKNLYDLSKFNTIHDCGYLKYEFINKN